MNFTMMTTRFRVRESRSVHPTTSRGRALYSVDWFLNGRPVLRNHDNPCLSLRNGLYC